MDSGPGKLTNTELRNRGSGECSCLLAIREPGVQCPCEHAILGIQSLTVAQGNENCQKTMHPLSLHEDWAPSLGTNSFSCHGSSPVHTNKPKEDVNKAFKDGIYYTPPYSEKSDEEWEYQPHPNLYETLAAGVLDHYDNYKNEKFDKTSMPTYLYVGRPGTGRSRNASEFSRSVKSAIASQTQHPLHGELTQRLKTDFVFHISFEGVTALKEEELSSPMNAIGVRMLHQLLDLPFSYIRSSYVAHPIDVFRLVAAATNLDIYNEFTAILVIDDFQDALGRLENNEDSFYEMLTQINSSLVPRRPAKNEGKTLIKSPFIITCVTATRIDPRRDFSFNAHCKRVYLPLNQLNLPVWNDNYHPVARNSPIARCLVKDVGGHPKAMEILVNELNKYDDGLPPSEDEDKVSTAIYTRLDKRYREAVEWCKDQLNYQTSGRITHVGL